METESEGAPYQAAAKGGRQEKVDSDSARETRPRHGNTSVSEQKGVISCSCASCMQNGVDNASPFHLPATSSPLTMIIGQRGICGVRLGSL